MSYAIDLAAWRLTPFAAPAEMIEAMRHHSYRDPLNAAYRAAVEAKIAITDASGMGTTATSHSDERREIVDASGAVNQTAAGVAQAAEQEAATQELASLLGSQAVAPVADLSGSRINVSSVGAASRATVTS